MKNSNEGKFTAENTGKKNMFIVLPNSIPIIRVYFKIIIPHFPPLHFAKAEVLSSIPRCDRIFFSVLHFDLDLLLLSSMI